MPVIRGHRSFCKAASQEVTGAWHSVQRQVVRDASGHSEVIL